MNTNTLRALALACLPLLAFGCKKESSFDKLNRGATDETPSADDPVQLEVTADKAAKLGEDIVFHVKLTNSGKSPVQVNVPRIDRRSLTLRVRHGDGAVAKVERIHATLGPRLEFIYDAPDAKQLAAGESFTTDVPVLAVETGKLAFTPSYVRQGAASALVGSTIEVDVAPADPAAPRLGVKMETSFGSVTAVFRPDVAYNTVESFASLVKRSFFTGLKFHRIVAGFMAQGGDKEGTGGGPSPYYLPLEANRALRHTRGVLSMARTNNPDTSGTQFFLMFAPNSGLDGQYTAFGEMLEGEETLKKLEKVPCGPGGDGAMSAPKQDVLILRANLVHVK